MSSFATTAATYEYERMNFQDMIHPVTTLPDIFSMDVKDYREHILLSSMNIENNTHHHHHQQQPPQPEQPLSRDAATTNDNNNNENNNNNNNNNNNTTTFLHDDDIELLPHFLEEHEATTTNNDRHKTSEASVVSVQLDEEDIEFETRDDKESYEALSKSTSSFSSSTTSGSSSPATTNTTNTTTIEKMGAKKPTSKKRSEVETTSTASVAIPHKFDILCGQSRICANHSGNRRFQVVLDIYASKYDKATNKQEKMNLTKEIVSSIGTCGGRFLKFKEGVWEEISTVMARDKVSHALRTKVASWKRQEQQQQQQESSQSTTTSPSTGNKKNKKKAASFSATSTKTTPIKRNRRRRRSSSSIVTALSSSASSSFDSNDRSSASPTVLDDLLKAQREIFASLTKECELNRVEDDDDDESVEEHPLKRAKSC